MKYYVIYSSEDGDISITPLSKEELEERLKEDYWGADIKFLTEKDDLEYSTGILIIKGEIVMPQPKKVVEEWSV